MDITLDPILVLCRREAGSTTLMTLTLSGQYKGDNIAMTVQDHEGAIIGIAREILRTAMDGRSRPEVVDHWIDVALRRALPDDCPGWPEAMQQSHTFGGA